jgi:hypothetical protein
MLNKFTARTELRNISVNRRSLARTSQLRRLDTLVFIVMVSWHFGFEALRDGSEIAINNPECSERGPWRGLPSDARKRRIVLVNDVGWHVPGLLAVNPSVSHACCRRVAEHYRNIVLEELLDSSPVLLDHPQRTGSGLQFVANNATNPTITDNNC